jgi:phosphoribosyl 1,2-cyclic phosphodiesterase
MKVAVLASGSSGNAIWVSGASTSILVDAGISARRVGTSMEALGLSPDGLDAVLVTHEHSDHVSGLGPLVRRHDLPAYATEGTHAAIEDRVRDLRGRVVVRAGEPFGVGGLEIAPFAVSHDCCEPVGYSVSDGDATVTIATDLGVVDNAVRDHLSRADCVVLEFNHDERMLIEGDYPWFLKQRIAGRAGHLSNEAAARELITMAEGPMSALVLAHLSRENNTPVLAESSAREALDRAGRGDVSVYLANQAEALGPVDVVRREGNETTTIGAVATCTR